jgi:hypothetical protein
MTVEASVITLTTQTTALLDTCVALKDDTAGLIASAVAVSENASQIPLVTVATNMINTQTLFINLLSGS